MHESEPTNARPDMLAIAGELLDRVRTAEAAWFAWVDGLPPDQLREFEAQAIEAFEGAPDNSAARRRWGEVLLGIEQRRKQNN